jgi:hypothetical protein
MLVARLLHIVVAMWFISGLLGRWLTYGQARRAGEIQSASALLQLSDRFDRLMVIPGSQAVLALGLITAWLQGQPIFGALQGASANWLLASLALFVGFTPVVFLVLAPRRRRRLRVAEAALAQGALTGELRAALDDRVVLAGRAAELLVMAIILALMILKPF